MDTTLSSLLYDALSDGGSGASAEALLAFEREGALPINWGEIVPLSMILPNSSRNGTARDISDGAGGRESEDAVKVIVFSIPASRYNHSVAMMDGLLKMGGRIYDVLDAAPHKILWYICAAVATTLTHAFTDAVLTRVCKRWNLHE